ncbi:MAG: hypothetical protein JNL04_06955 [Rhodospirillaceae bacterium]|nr:hypothetical protein [Rhodospirillaceae bacterium]
MKVSIAGAAVMLAVAAVFATPGFVGTGSAAAACDPGTRIDASTANGAKRRFEAAGYRNVRVIKKGCDNYWHGMGAKNGTEGRIVLAPSGEVLPEND